MGAKEIQLTQGKIALVDDEDFEKLNQYKWCATKYGNNFRAERRCLVNGKSKIKRMHREITNAPKHLEVDHKDGNGLNNQKINLRICTHQENGFNQTKPRKNNKLGIKGVCWHKIAEKFQAQIQVNGKGIYLGLFSVLGDADDAYRRAEKKYFGEFARRI